MYRVTLPVCEHRGLAVTQDDPQSELHLLVDTDSVARRGDALPVTEKSVARLRVPPPPRQHYSAGGATDHHQMHGEE